MLAPARSCALGAVRRSDYGRSAFKLSSHIQRLASTLALLEQREGKLNASSLSAITAAERIGGTIHGFVAGSKAVAEETAKVKGVEKVLMVDNPAYNKVRALNLQTRRDG